jgi:predicted DNA-binding transcriptional regulator YafY
MNETSTRLLTLLSLLQTHRDWTGAELAERLEISGRTVRKDVERLRDLGYPVEATRGPVGGYRLGPGATMPPLLLDDEEAVATAVGLMDASTQGIAGIEEVSLRALVKLEQVLPTRLRRRVESIRGFATSVRPDHDGPQVDATVLQVLASACRDHEMQRISYQKHDGTQTRRLIEPHRVVSWGRRWYVVAWDDDRADWRTFRVDRIAKSDPTGRPFRDRPLPDPDISAYIARSVSRAGWRYHLRFTVFAPAQSVLEQINPAVGTVTPIDETSCILESGADDLWMAAVYIGTLGYDFRVDEPPELVDYLREISDRYARATTGPSLSAETQ